MLFSWRRPKPDRPALVNADVRQWLEPERPSRSFAQDEADADASPGPGTIAFGASGKNFGHRQELKGTHVAMKKPIPSNTRAGRGSMRSRSSVKPKTDIAAGLERLDQLRPESAQAAGLIKILRSWLADESGYDEQTWPKLKKALEQERRRVGARSLFDG
jgi:hypothetical protein